MEYMRPEMVDHEGDGDGERQRRLSPEPGVSQVPPPPPQRGRPDGGDPELLREDSPRGRGNQADTVDQQRAWQNADDGTEQTYSGADPV